MRISKAFFQELKISVIALKKNLSEVRSRGFADVRESISSCFRRKMFSRRTWDVDFDSEKQNARKDLIIEASCPV